MGVFFLAIWGPHCVHVFPECPFPSCRLLYPWEFPFPLGGSSGYLCRLDTSPPPRAPLPCTGSSSQRVGSQELTQHSVSSVECVKGTVGTLLLENPPGQNGLTHQGLLYEAAKVFGLRSRKLKLFLNETQTDGEDMNALAALSSFLCFFCQE